MPVAVVTSVRTTVVAPSRSIPSRRPREPVDAGRGPAGRHAADPVVIGRGAPQDEVQEGLRAAGGRAGRRRRGRRSVAPSVSMVRARVRPRADHLRAASCRAQTSKPGGRPCRSRGRRDADGQRMPLPDDPRRHPARQIDRRPGAGVERRERRTGRPRPERRPRSARSVAAAMPCRGSADDSGSRPVLRRGPLARPPIRTGAASARCSHIAGFGRRSGQTSPSAHEVAVVRLLTEVTAVRPARADRPAGPGRGRGPRTPR